MNTIKLISLCIIALYSCTVSTVGVYTDIYRVLDAYPCVRLLDKNGPVGCAAPESGTVGDLHILSTQEDLDGFYKSPPSESKAVVLPASLFNKEVLNKLHDTKKLDGILLSYDSPAVAGWSPDTTNPNSQWGLQGSTLGWNPQGDGLNFERIPVPIYALSEEETAQILQLNTDDISYPRHAVRFNTFMHATVDAKTCLRRGQCLPLGGKSVWSTYNTVGSKPIIMAMANMDSTALFHDLAVGADSTVSGIVGLLGAALALQPINRSTFVSDIMFSFWAGESWGYLGSRKFLDDIQHFQCEDKSADETTCNKPYNTDLSFQAIKLQNIVAAIELNQIGLTTDPDPTLYIHQQNTAANPISSLLLSVSNQAALGTVLQQATDANGIPPSSLMSFLSSAPNLPGVVITDHKLEYKNRNYHSHMDTAEFNKLSNASLCDAATLLAQTLYLLAMNGTQQDPAVVKSIQAPCDVITELIICLASNFSCEFIDNFLGPDRPTTPSYYIGVFGGSIWTQYVSTMTQFVYYYMSNITNQLPYTTCSSSKPCSDDQLCIGGICTYSETHFHDAISLGIDWDYSKDTWKIVNESQPLWVESNWDSVGVEIFLRDNPTTEALFLTAGIVEFLGSMVAVFYVKRYFLRNFRIL